MKKILVFILALTSIVCYGRVDFKCLVNYGYNVRSSYGSYTYTYSEPKQVTVSFISGAEYNPRKPSTDRFAIVWFSQTNCAVIKLKPKRITSVEKLSLQDLYDVMTAGGVYGEQINGGENDDMDMPYSWYITLRDRNNGYDFVDPKLREYNLRTDYSLYAL